MEDVIDTPMILTAEAPPRAGWHRRVFSAKAAGHLLRNTIVSCCTFAFGLGLMWLLVEQAGVNKLVAAGLSFLLANTIHYIFATLWIFPGSERALGPGYVFFFANALIGMVATVALFDLSMYLMSSHYLVARVVASLFAGLVMFLLNAMLNFRTV